MWSNGARFAVVILLLLGSPESGRSEEGPSADPLDSLIAQNAHRLQWTSDGPSGPGWEMLVAEGRAAELFLIGESHGNRETPRLTVALAKALRPAGYSAFGIEVGPVTARRLVGLCGTGDGAEAFRRFLEEFPFSFPFFWWREEAEMLCQVLDQGYEVWGLDQEFIGSARFLLGELLERVSAGEQRTRIQGWLDQARAGFQRFATSGDSTHGFLSTIDPDELAALARTLPAGSRAHRIVDELQRTAVVYQHYQAGRHYENNHERIRLMKHHLAGYVEAAGGLESVPKAVFKFGSVHMGRGYSPLHQLDVGNAAAELAAVLGSDSLHVYVVAPGSVDREGNVRDWIEAAPHLSRFADLLEEDAWGLFDLRPLRPHFAVDRNRRAEPELAELVFRYDVLLLAPLFHAAEPMIDLPF